MTKQQKKNPLPELLSPAGSMAALEAAVDGGADAVYLGANAFNARMRAGNFTDAEMGRALELCRAFGVRAYITLNTRLYDSELQQAVRLARQLWSLGADAFIIADLGLGARLRQCVPEAELHASTQTSARTPEDARALLAAGYSRMVCPREVTAAELARLCRLSPIPIEMFIHGAYCVSYSGQCLMSAVMGGRSGNRGECAQPCRLPYTLNGRKGYPLSLRDMCLAGHVKDILASGAASLKIEGRQKSPEYVYGVTKVWRTLLDEERNAAPEELEQLARLFSRDGFSDGYFSHRHGDMLGVRTLEQFRQTKTEPYGGLSRKEPVSMTLALRVGQPAVLTASTAQKTVTVATEMPLAAGDSAGAMREENARKNAGRLGTTPFALQDFRMTAEGDALFTLSMLNNLRRRAVAALLAPPQRKCDGVEAGVQKSETAPKQVQPVYTAQFLASGQITPLAREFFRELYLPVGNHVHGAMLPPALSGPDWQRVWEQAQRAPYVLVHTPGQLAEAVRRGIPAHPSFRFNVYNSDSAAQLVRQGASSVFLSPELSAGGMRAVHSAVPKGAVVYGRLPVMLTMRCALSDGGRVCGGNKARTPYKGCGSFSDGSLCAGELRDRKGFAFPVTGMADCTNMIWNSIPIYMADRQAQLQRAGISRLHFIFTTETAEECDRMIQAWQRSAAPPDGMAIRRI